MSGIETPEAPAWLSKLESQREKQSKAKLGHDSGAGSACNSCGPACPGLDLHFWRKVCRACHCPKDVHDVQNDEYSGWTQFELLGKVRPKITRPILMKINGIGDKPVKLDWVPPNTSPDLVSDYMSSLGGDLAPVVGTEGAARRREQLRRQIPRHDISSDYCCHTLNPQEQDKHQEYISQIKNNVVGVGNIVRIGTIRKGDVLSIHTVGSQPVPGVKSYSLPLKLTNSSVGLKYNSIPKNTTDKLLVLDNMGNVINKSGYLADYKTSPILSGVVKDKLNSMKIESDRIKSAVEHGPVYDKLFRDLRHLNVPVDRDVYLTPIRLFRLEYNANPKFRDETTAFAETQGAKLMRLSPHNLNNNDDYAIDNFAQFAHPQKGTIFAPDGEIWSWSSTGEIPPNNPYNERATQSIHPNQLSEMDRNYGSGYPLSNQYDSMNDVPPIPNFSTHPNMGMYDGPKLNTSSNDSSMNKNIGGSFRDNIPEDFNTNTHNRMKLNMPREGNLDVITEGVNNLALARPNEISEVSELICQRCQNPIKQGDVAVKAERAGDNVAWHPQCFTCIECNQLLADLVYFYHKGEIYCARDLSDVMELLRCAACDELIFSKLYTVAEGKPFHHEHFCCYHCDMQLGDKHYVPDDKSGHSICLPCYDKYHAAVCNSCKKIIGPDQQGVSWSSFHWHGTCFNCAASDCKKSLLSGRFVVKDEMPFCSSACVRNTIQN